MIEVRGNLWDYECDAIVITTNGFVKNNGEAVMGRGCALEAANRIDNLPSRLGKHIKDFGNTLTVFWDGYQGYDGDSGEVWAIDIVTFPVKHNWWEKADLDLIQQSCIELRSWANEMRYWKKIIIPRPGCGNGGRDWETEVKPILEKYLDERFYVITF